MSNYIDLANNLLELGRKEGYIRSTEYTFIPELLMWADDTCQKVLSETIRYCQNDSTSPGLTFVVISFGWSAYAGMGAVYLWNKDWDKLSHKGVYESLTAPRGYNEMDEYVLDSIGIPFHSKEAEQLTRFIQKELVPINIVRAFPHGAKPDLPGIIQAAKAMFVFGMVYEMNRLGMY